MSLSATLFGRNSAIFKVTNILGLGIPGWLDDTFGAQAAQGPALGEMAVQTSKEGVDRPIVYGICRPIAGNLIAVQDPPRIKKIKQRNGGGGKGGGGGEEVKVDTPFRTYAIRICEGPITGVRRVWRNGKLVYDARGNEWGVKNNKVFLKLAKFYLGSFDQLPAPELQAVFGINNVPAHRGTAYHTMSEEDLSETSGAVPQYIYEVERAEGYALTSRPYPVEDLEEARTVGHVLALSLRDPTFEYEDAAAEGAQTMAASVTGMVFRNPLVQLETLDAAETAGTSITGMVFRQPLVQLEPTLDAAETAGASISGVVFRAGLIPYANWPIEAAETTGHIISGMTHGTG